MANAEQDAKRSSKTLAASKNGISTSQPRTARGISSASKRKKHDKITAVKTNLKFRNVKSVKGILQMTKLMCLNVRL